MQFLLCFNHNYYNRKVFNHCHIDILTIMYSHSLGMLYRNRYHHALVIFTLISASNDR